MGIDYDVICVFGVEYSFEELENYKKYNRDNNDDDDDNLISIWYGNGYYQASPYFDSNEEERSYLLGYKLGTYISPNNMREILEKEDEIKKMIKEFSEKYNVINKENEIQIIYLPNIW